MKKTFRVKNITQYGSNLLTVFSICAFFTCFSEFLCSRQTNRFSGYNDKIFSQEALSPSLLKNRLHRAVSFQKRMDKISGFSGGWFADKAFPTNILRENGTLSNEIKRQRFSHGADNMSSIDDIKSYLKIAEVFKAGRYRDSLAMIQMWERVYKSSVLQKNIEDFKYYAYYKLGGREPVTRARHFIYSNNVEAWNSVFSKLLSSEELLKKDSENEKRDYTNEAAVLIFLIPADVLADKMFQQTLLSLLRLSYKDSFLKKRLFSDKPDLYHKTWLKLFYLNGYYDYAISYYENHFLNREGLKNDMKSLYYFGVSCYKSGLYKKTAYYLKEPASHWFDLKQKGYRRAAYYYLYALTRRGRRKEAFTLLKSHKSRLSEPMFRLFLKSASGDPSFYQKLTADYMKRYPDTYEAYLIKKKKAFSDLTQGRTAPGLISLSNAFRTRSGDLAFYSAYFTGRTFEIDLSYKRKGALYAMEGLHQSGPLIASVSNDSLEKVFFPEDETFKSNYCIKHSPFFSNLLLSPKCSPTNRYVKRFYTLLALDLYDAAEHEIKTVFKDNDFLKYAFLHRLFEYKGDSQNSILKISYRAFEKTGIRKDLLPSALLKKLYPLEDLFYWPVVRQASFEAGISPLLALSVIRAESMFDPYAVSPSGARGLMQIMEATGRGLYRGGKLRRWYPYNYFDPVLNVKMGIRYLGYLNKRFASLTLTAAGYNGGPGNVKKWMTYTGSDELRFALLIPVDETERYVKKVYDNLYYYQKLYPHYSD